MRGASAHGQHTFLVSVVRHESAYVLGQAAVDRKTNEITAVPALLAGRNLTGTVTTMDALLTQRHIAELILAQGGHYFMIIKQNQPTMYAAVQLVFVEPPLPQRPGERDSTRTFDKAHGRGERRTLITTTALNDYLRWPGAAQVLRRVCRRIHERTGKLETEVTYGITSLPRPSSARPSWSVSGAGIGPSKTACTMCATRPSAKTAARFIAAPAPKPWRLSATQ